MKIIHSALILILILITTLNGCAAYNNSTNEASAMPTSSAAAETVAPTDTPTATPIFSDSEYSPNNTSGCIGNKNTKKFHLPSCSSIDKMKESNKVRLSDRDEAINRGYVPCQRCCP